MHVQSCCFPNLARDFFLSVAVVVAFSQIYLSVHVKCMVERNFVFGQSQFSIRLTCAQRFW